MSGMTNYVTTLPAAPTRVDALEVQLQHQKVPMSARAFLTGIKAIDRGISPAPWTGGKLIGVVSGTGPSLTENFISEHLLSFHERIVQNRDSGTGFIIAPHSSSIVSTIHSRISDRVSHLQGKPSSLDALQYLDKVQLLQYFDFAGLTESVAEVSALLFKSSTSSDMQAVLYLEGVGIATETLQRRSGMVQANSLLSSLLRTLIHLSRSYPCLLILLDLGLRKDSKGNDAIQSAFASATGSGIRYHPGGALGRTLVGALDVVVVVHDAHSTVTDGSMVVEVVKDRVGGALGQWTVWDPKK